MSQPVALSFRDDAALVCIDDPPVDAIGRLVRAYGFL
jgi:hypothetical protein